jgi:hypothetical protein
MLSFEPGNVPYARPVILAFSSRPPRAAEDALASPRPLALFTGAEVAMRRPLASKINACRSANLNSFVTSVAALALESPSSLDSMAKLGASELAVSASD